MKVLNFHPSSNTSQVVKSLNNYLTKYPIIATKRE